MKSLGREGNRSSTVLLRVLQTFFKRSSTKRPVQLWCRIGVGLVSDWCRIGVGCTIFAPKLHQSCTKQTPKRHHWCRFGVVLVLSFLDALTPLGVGCPSRGVGAAGAGALALPNPRNEGGQRISAPLQKNEKHHGRCLDPWDGRKTHWRAFQATQRPTNFSFPYRNPPRGNSGFAGATSWALP
jgi:hypothetical protein